MCCPELVHFSVSTQVWRVDIEEITGKARGASKWVTGKSIHEVQDMGPSKWLKDVPL